MKNSHRFFANRDCKYYPCHEGLEDMNCLFCYCPFFLSEECPGGPTFWESDGRIIKDCSNCVFPHRPENYERVIEAIKEAGKAHTYSEEIRKKAVHIEKKRET